MILIAGSASDPLIRGVREALNRSGRETISLEEQEALESPIAIHQRGAERWGTLSAGDRRIPFESIGSALVRMPRAWWPSQEMTLKDQMFVYHETTSAWFYLLDSLPGAVLNRFGLGWWVQDGTYPLGLREGLGAALGIGFDPAVCAPPQTGRLLPSPRPHSGEFRSVYAAGSRFVPGPGSGAQAAWLGQRRAAFARWQRQTGIGFCRVDFLVDPHFEIAAVEPLPPIDGEQDDVAEAVIGAVEGALV